MAMAETMLESDWQHGEIFRGFYQVRSATLNATRYWESFVNPIVRKDVVTEVEGDPEGVVRIQAAMTTSKP